MMTIDLALFKHVPKYPEISVKEKSLEGKRTELKFSTMLRINREGKYYLVYCDLLYNISVTYDKFAYTHVHNLFIKHVYEMMHLYKVSDIDVLDTNQEDESERLMKLNKFNNKAL